MYNTRCLFATWIAKKKHRIIHGDIRYFMGLRLLEIFKFLQRGDCLYTSESDRFWCIKKILTLKGLNAWNIEITSICFTGVLAGATGAGKVAMWKWSPMSGAGATKQEPEDKWKLQPPSMVGGSATDLNVGTTGRTSNISQFVSLRGKSDAWNLKNSGFFVYNQHSFT